MQEKRTPREKIRRVGPWMGKDAKGISPAVRRSRIILLRQTFFGIFLGLCGFLLGRCTLLFGARPLGIGLLCAATSGVPWIFAGLSLSALTEGQNAAVLLCTYVAALLIRALSRSVVSVPEKPAGNTPTDKPAEGIPFRVTFVRFWAMLFGESVYLRMMTACVSAFIISLYTIIVGGFVYYDLFGALLSMVIAPVSVYLYAGLFGGRASASLREKTIFRWVALGALTFSLLFSLRQTSLFGISLAVFIGFLLTLCISRRKGALWGMTCALLCALAAAPGLTPSFALGALVYASLSGVSLLLGAGASFGLATAWDIYLNRLAALSSTTPAFLAAAMLALGADSLIMAKDPFSSLFPDADRLERAELTDVTEQQLVDMKTRIRDMSTSFSALSEMFYSLSHRLRRPGMLDLRRVCDRAFDRICPGCANRDLCWGADYTATLALLSHMAGALYQAGRLTEEDIEERFRGHCHLWRELLEAVNADCATLTELTMRTEKTEVFAADYRGMSELLCDALAEQNAEFLYDEETSARVMAALRDIKMEADGVLVYGTRRRRLIARGLDVSAARLGEADIHDKLEQACGFALGEIFFDFSREGVTLQASTRPVVSASHAASVDAREKDACGDTVDAFQTDNDYFYAIICDGMGSGREAAFTSGVCSVFLEKMLMAGNRTETTLRMLSSLIRQKGGGLGVECSSTVDLMELDLLTGKAVFLKSGAAPTFIKRGEDIFKLSAHTSPIGILPKLDTQKIAYDVLPGDFMIMVSDGITGGEEEPAWLLTLLGERWEPSPTVMAEKIMAAARQNGSDDDLSVLIVAVESED